MLSIQPAAMDVEQGPKQADSTSQQSMLVASRTTPTLPPLESSALPPTKDALSSQTGPQRSMALKVLLRLRDTVVTHYLPMAFAVALTVALAYPAPGKAVIHVTILGDVHLIQEILIGIVFFISGLTLKTDDAAKALVHWRGVLFGAASILLFTPCVGFIFRIIPFHVRAFNIGLMIFSIVPTTLGIGVALVRACKGNEGLSLILTISTNMLGVFTMPLWVKFLFINYSTEGLDMNIRIEHLLVKLLITITGPAVFGKAVRELWKGAPRFTATYKVPLSLFSTTCLAVIVWQTLSSAREVLFSAPAVDIIAVILLAVGQHIFYLSLTAFIVVYVIKMPLEEAIAVAITAGQKSAPVAVTVISYITGSPAVQGLLSIPAICGQLNMILVGSIISPWLARLVIKTRAERKEAAALAAAVQLAGFDPSAATPADTSVRETTNAAASALNRHSGSSGGTAYAAGQMAATSDASPSVTGLRSTAAMQPAVVVITMHDAPALTNLATPLTTGTAAQGGGDATPAADVRRKRC